jgi:hypothetical protein
LLKALNSSLVRNVTIKASAWMAVEGKQSCKMKYVKKQIEAKAVGKV